MACPPPVCAGPPRARGLSARSASPAASPASPVISGVARAENSAETSPAPSPFPGRLGGASRTDLRAAAFASPQPPVPLPQKSKP